MLSLAVVAHATLRHVDTIMVDELGIISVVIVAHHLASCALPEALFAFFIIGKSFLGRFSLL